MVHSGIDIARDANDRQLAAGRFNQATLVVERLYRALKAGERVWGTSQLSGLPNIRMNNDRTINAAANWSTNSLYINRGLFDLVEKVGTKGEDVLAATLAHELGHIFYHHPGYGSGQGVKGLFDELRGVTALDRIQEKEADFLGLRLTCQAGFDPQGMLILMKTFAAMDNGAGSFARNHPSGAERFNYLLEEAMKCQTLQSEKRPSSRPNDVQQVSTQNAPVSSRPDLTTGGEPLWKLAQNPNSHWKFKFGESFLYGERLMPDERRQRGEFDNVDVKKQGSIFVGTQHMRVALKIKDDSRQGFHYKSCQWDFAVELTEVSRERLEGRWEGYSKDSKINPLTCVRSGERIWEDVAWILE